MARTKGVKEFEGKKRGRKQKPLTDVIEVSAEPVAVEHTEASNSSKTRKSIFSGIFVKLLLLTLVLGGVGYYVYTHKSAFIAAKVGDQFILRSELNDKLAERYGSQVLEDLVTVTLIKRELANNSVIVSDGDIDERVKEIEKTLTGYTLEQALSAQGMTLNQLKDNLRLQIGLSKLLGDKVSVTSEEVDEFIKQNGTFLTATDDEGKKQEAQKNLKDQKLGEEINKLITDLKAKSKVEKYL